MSDIPITVVAPAFYQNPAHATRYLRASAARYGVPIHWYGEGEPYRGWLDVQLHRLLDVVDRITTPYVLYVDGSDSIFTADLPTIWEKYVRDFRKPDILISHEPEGINPGGILAATGALHDALAWIGNGTTFGDESNPMIRWREAVEDQEVMVEPDIKSWIFVCNPDNRLRIEHQPIDPADPGEGTEPALIYGDIRGTEVYPCVVHFAGGYTDPEVGKAAIIEPWWKELGYARQ